MNGIIAFESATSEFLECSCGNSVMASGFDQLATGCENVHYRCARSECAAIACVDFSLRVVNNIDAEQAGVQEVIS